MWRPTTFAPEGGVPAYCTDASSEEQGLSEPYKEVFFNTPAESVESVDGGDVWLKPHTPYHCRSSSVACGELKPYSVIAIGRIRSYVMLYCGSIVPCSWPLLSN
jgi:hypothetical protein